MKTKILLLSALFIAAIPVRAAVHPDAGTRAGSSFMIQGGARPRGMGNAFSAVSNDANALFGNPAGLGRLSDMEITATDRQLFEGIHQNSFGGAVPLKSVTSADVRTFGALGVSMSVMDYGNLTGRDSLGNLTANFGAKDKMMSVAYGKAFGKRLFLGLNVKQYKQRITDRKADGLSYDGGLIYQLPSERWTLALSALNRGNDLHFVGSDEHLSEAVVGGVAFTPAKDVLTFAVDMVDAKDDFTGLRAGAEWRVIKILALRTGYDSTGELGDGFTAGVGLRITEFEAAFFPIKVLSLDYSFEPSSVMADGETAGGAGIHNVSVTMRFGD